MQLLHSFNNRWAASNPLLQVVGGMSPEQGDIFHCQSFGNPGSCILTGFEGKDPFRTESLCQESPVQLRGLNSHKHDIICGVEHIARKEAEFIVAPGFKIGDSTQNNPALQRAGVLQQVEGRDPRDIGTIHFIALDRPTAPAAGTALEQGIALESAPVQLKNCLQ